MFFKLAQKVTIHLGYFCRKTYHKEHSKVAQSDHTATDKHAFIVTLKGLRYRKQLGRENASHRQLRNLTFLWSRKQSQTVKVPMHLGDGFDALRCGQSHKPSTMIMYSSIVVRIVVNLPKIVNCNREVYTRLTRGCWDNESRYDEGPFIMLWYLIGVVSSHELTLDFASLISRIPFYFFLGVNLM